MIDLKELFQKHDDELLKFDRIHNKLSSRPDIHAFILLNQLVTDADDIICNAEHDQIWLSVTLDQLESVATEDQIVELIRCGVRLDGEHDGLAMFV